MARLGSVAAMVCLHDCYEEGHPDAVRRRANVRLQVPETQPGGHRERCERVLRGQPGPTTMGDRIWVSAPPITVTRSACHRVRGSVSDREARGRGFAMISPHRQIKPGSRPPGHLAERAVGSHPDKTAMAELSAFGRNRERRE